MSKNKTRGLVFLAILLIVFSAIAFLPPFNRNTIFGTAYLFGLIAILSQLYFISISFGGKGDAKSKFYGFPIAQIGVVYLIAQLVISLVEMVLASLLALWMAVLINIIAVAVAYAGTIAADTMREEIERQDTVLKKNVSAMRELQSMANGILSQCDHPGMKQDLQKVADELRYSDPVTSDASAPLENEMLAQLKEIQRATVDADSDAVKAMCGKLLANLTERNRVCKLGK